MAKAKTLYVCSDCGAQHLKWQGQCPDCGAWNSLVEAPSLGHGPQRPAMRGQYAGETARAQLSKVSIGQESRVSTGLAELDRVLGGGLVAGSVNLIGGLQHAMGVTGCERLVELREVDLAVTARR